MEALCVKAILPVTRASGVMCERNNNKFIISFKYYNGERESVQQQSFGSKCTSFTCYRYKWRHFFAQKLNCIFKCFNQPQTKLRAFIFLPQNSMLKFIGNLCQNSNFHQLPFTRFLTRAKTSSGSSRVALPASISFIRRHISISQACAASMSAGPS